MTRNLIEFVFHLEVMDASEWRVLTGSVRDAVARGAERVLAFGYREAGCF